MGAAALVRPHQCGGESGCAATLVLILNAMHHSTRARRSPARSISGRGSRYAVIYALGVPVLRTLAFTVGFIAQATLVLAIFGKL